MELSTLALASFTVVVAHRAVLTLYRLLFQPLAGFPGPNLVAASRIYEFYWDVIKGGQFMWRIKDMHDRYCPIVRISPDELHIMVPNFWDELYNPSGPSKRRDKFQWWVAGMGAEGALVMTIDQDLHKARRASLRAMFSQKAVVELEPLIRDKVEVAKSTHPSRHRGRNCPDGLGL